MKPARAPGSWRVAAALLLASAAVLAPRPGRGEEAVQAAVPSAAAPAAADGGQAGSLEEKWGVRIVGIRQSAAGHMLDFRYQVLDAEKAKPLFVRQTKPKLIDQATGREFFVPNLGKVGPLRNSDIPLQGRTYWMFFGNIGKLVKPGSRVTVAIGDFRAENLVVQ